MSRKMVVTTWLSCQWPDRKEEPSCSMWRLQCRCGAWAFWQRCCASGTSVQDREFRRLRKEVERLGKLLEVREERNVKRKKVNGASNAEARRGTWWMGLRVRAVRAPKP